MIKYALYAQMEAKPGQEAAAEQFLRAAEALARDEKGTVGWFAIRMSPSTFGVFDVFENESDRKAHVAGKLASTLMEKAPELFTQTPEIHMIDVIASKLPTDSQLKDVA